MPNFLRSLFGKTKKAPITLMPTPGNVTYGPKSSVKGSSSTRRNSHISNSMSRRRQTMAMPRKGPVNVTMDGSKKIYDDCVFIVDKKRDFNNPTSNGSSYIINIKNKEQNIEYTEYDKSDYKFSYLVDKTNVPNIQNHKVRTLYDMHECIIKKYLNTPNIVVNYGYALYSSSNGECNANYNNANTHKHSNSRGSKNSSLTFQSSQRKNRSSKRSSVYGFNTSNS